MARGWPVYATARRIEDLSELEAKGCRVLALDVCDHDSIEAAVKEVEASAGAVGVLVNNAGYGQDGAVEELTMDQLRRQFETNVFGLVRLTQLVLPGMRTQRWGRIVNVSSMGGRMTLPGGGAYHASKHAVESLSDALRMEVRRFGVDVVVIEPGLIRTKFGDTAVGSVASLEDPTGPYASFNAARAAQVTQAYHGPIAKLAGVGPEVVAKVIERAITARRPRTRYPVTLGAHAMIRLRKWLPDRVFDAFVEAQLGVKRAGRRAS